MDGMKKAILGCAACVAMCVFCARGDSEKPGDEGEAFDRMLNTYYRAPDSAKAIAAIPHAVKFAKGKSSARAPLSGFYFGAASKSLDRKDAWEKSRKGLKARWLDQAIGRALDGKKLSDVVDGDPKKMGPATLDFLWGYFLATGDAESPRMVIERGGVVFPEDASFDLTASSAQWSALSLAHDHPIVKAELEKFALEANEKALGNFFGDSIPAEARSLFSKDAIARIEAALAKMKKTDTKVEKSAAPKQKKSAEAK